ncbi:MAG: dTMP kinase [Dehalococcoidia bacterium]
MFITFEGGEGSGKSTQASLLAAALESQGHSVTLTQEPRGTDFGLLVWELLARGVAPASELFLFAAARAHHVRTVIRPALERGDIVVCDRFSDSTIAYQEYGRRLDRELVRRACRYAEGGVSPTLTFLLDVAPEEGLKRKDGAVEDDAISAETLDFHRRVRAGYLELARDDPRFHVLDGTKQTDELRETIAQTLVEALKAAKPL